jgi:hypothetical protein
MARVPVGATIRLPVIEVGEPQVCPPAKSRKQAEPIEVFPTNEKTIRLALPMSAVFERRNRFW